MSLKPVTAQQFYESYASEFQRPLAERLPLSPSLCQYIQRLDQEHAAIRKLHAQDLNYISDDWCPWLRRMIRAPIAAIGGYTMAKGVLLFAPASVKAVSLLVKVILTATFGTAVYQDAAAEPFTVLKEVWAREIWWIRQQQEAFDAPLATLSALEKTQRTAVKEYFLKLLTTDFDLTHGVSNISQSVTLDS